MNKILGAIAALRNYRFRSEGETVAQKAAAAYARIYNPTTTKLAFFAAAAALAAYLAASVGAEVAAAQQQPGGGGATPQGGDQFSGDAIHTTLGNVRDYIASILLSLGGIGFAVSLGLKAIAGPNENMHHASHLGMKGSGIAVLGGAMIGPIMDIITGLAAGGGSGGGG